MVEREVQGFSIQTIREQQHVVRLLSNDGNIIRVVASKINTLSGDSSLYIFGTVKGTCTLLCTLMNAFESLKLSHSSNFYNIC